MTTQPEVFQVKWFNKKKGYGFASNSTGEEVFCHHSDISVDGYKYLKRGEFVRGVRVQMENGKTKIGSLKPPMDNGKLMCEVERTESSAREREA
jgi:CspA family cold shock protein